MADRLDHGILNIPLSKRGNIDAQIDRYKRNQAQRDRAERKAHAAEMKTLRLEAKSLLAVMRPERLTELAVKFGVSPAQIRSKLRSDAHWQPRLVISLLKDGGTNG